MALSCPIKSLTFVERGQSRAFRRSLSFQSGLKETDVHYCVMSFLFVVSSASNEPNLANFWSQNSNEHVEPKPKLKLFFMTSKIRVA